MIGRLDKGALIAGCRRLTRAAEPAGRGTVVRLADLRPPTLLAVIDLFGSDHVVLGSDYPFPAMPDPIDDIVADLPTDILHRISRTNVEENYGALLGLGNDALSAAGGH